MRIEEKACRLFLGWVAIPPSIVLLRAFDPKDALIALPIVFVLWCSWWLLSLLSIAYVIELAHLARWKLVGLTGTVTASALLALPGGAVFHAGDLLRFTTMKRAYDRSVAQLPEGPLRLKIFSDEWDEEWLGPSDFVVYDSSGEIMLPARRRSPSWRDRAKAAHVPSPCVRPERLWGHYYVITVCLRRQQLSSGAVGGTGLAPVVAGNAASKPAD